MSSCPVCGDDVLNARSETTGGKLRLDPRADDTGSILLTGRTNGGSPIVRYLRRDEDPMPGARYTAHTCPVRVRREAR